MEIEFERANVDDIKGIIKVRNQNFYEDFVNILFVRRRYYWKQ
ncbi:hypothetical protein [Clostridium sp.]